jgi:hypothetical protein
MKTLLTELKRAVLAGFGAGWWVVGLCIAFDADRYFLTLSTLIVAVLAAISWLLSFEFMRMRITSGALMRTVRMTAWLSALTAATVIFFADIAGEIATRSNAMDVVLIVLVFCVPSGVVGSIWASLGTSSALRPLTNVSRASIQS